MENSLCAVYECGLMPFRHIAAAARAKYFLLNSPVMPLPHHLTTHALIRVTSPNNVYSKPTNTTEPGEPLSTTTALVRGTPLSCLRKWGTSFADHRSAFRSWICMHACLYKFITKSRFVIVLDNACSQKDWENEVLYFVLIKWTPSVKKPFIVIFWFAYI